MALWTDIHCHIIADVDDGAKDRKTAMELPRMEYDDGVRRIIVKPHFCKGMFETPWEKISEQFSSKMRDVQAIPGYGHPSGM
ncbi:MAG: hypothetical protein MR936_11425 [Eubacterium sp.]|nr:hypothetical protein [Eubacterium sp.]